MKRTPACRHAAVQVLALPQARPPLALLLAFGLLALLLAQITIPPAHGQDAVSISKHFSRLLPGASNTRNPSLALAGADLFIGAPNGGQDAAIWQANVLQAPFEFPLVIGSAAGPPAEAPVAVAAAADGSVYAAFIDQVQATLSLRRYADGEWQPERRVLVGGHESRRDLTLGIAGDTLFVFWRSPGAVFSYRSSSDGGLTWSAQRSVHAEHVGIGALAFAAGNDGAAYVAYAVQSGSELQIASARWDGSAFVDHEFIPRPGRNAAGPAIVVQADGKPLLAWREVEGGIYLAERAAGGWHVQLLADMLGHGAVALSRDQAGTIAAYWLSDYSGSIELYGVLRAGSGSWVGPERVGNDAFFLANLRADGLLHTVSEAFSGSWVTSRYVQFKAGGITMPILARPLLAEGRSVSAADSLPIRFVDTNSEIADFRWSWSAEALAEAAWYPFSPDANLMPPEDALDTSAGCTPLTIHTQVRSPGGGVQQTAASTSILLDRDVQLRAHWSAAGSAAATASNVVTTTLELDAGAECSSSSAGVTFAASGRRAQHSLPPAAAYGPIAAGSRQSYVLLLPTAEDVYTATVHLSDEHGHQASQQASIEYDASPPELIRPGQIEITANPQVTLRPTLHLRGLEVRDWFMGQDRNHGEPRIWGVLLRMSRAAPAAAGTQQLAIPLDPATLSFDPARQSEGIDAALEIPLEQLLGSTIASGTYQLQVQILDRAGNPSPPLPALELTLDRIVYPPLYLPLVPVAP